MSVRYHNEQREDVSSVMNNLDDAKKVLLAIIDSTRAAANPNNESDPSASFSLNGNIEVKTSKGTMVLKQVG